MDKDEILKCIKKAKEDGYEVKMRDVCYCLLTRSLSDIDIAYKAIYGSECDSATIKVYDNSTEIIYLKNYINILCDATSNEDYVKMDDITFEENRLGAVKMLKDLPTLLKDEKISYKEYYDYDTKLRSILVKTFQTNSSIDEQMIHVEAKYNDICPYCNHEVRAKVLTKEEAINMYNLKEQ